MKKVIFVTFFFIWNCNPSNNEHKLKSISMSPTIPTILGAGYDSHTENFKQSCIEYSSDQLRYTGQQQSLLDFSKKQDYFEMKDKLDVQVKGRLKLPTYGVKGAVKFLSDAKKTDKSISLIFGNSITGKSVLIDNPVLNSDGEKFAKSADQRRIRSRCGDYYVHGMELGAALWVNVKMEFMNADVKSEFEAEIDFDMVDLFSISGKAEVISNQVKDAATISISALQIGGDVTKLATILGAKSGDKDLPFIRCSLSKEGLQACQQALSNVIEYASAEFPNQITNWDWKTTQDAKSRNNGPAVMKYYLMNYSSGQTEKLWPYPSPVVDREITEARKFLLKRYELLLQDRSNFENFSLMNIEPEERRLAEKQILIVEANKDLVVEAATVCYDFPRDGECLKAKKYAIENQKKYDLTLVYRPYRFREYCYLNHVTESAKLTVKKITKSMGLKPNENCKRISDKLKSQTYLDLSSESELHQINDLRPLYGLTKLKRINLNNNSLVDLTELRDVPNLERLEVRKNSLYSLSGVENIKKLKFLDAAHNKLFEADEVLNLKRLEVLKLHGNPIEDYSNLEDLDLKKMFLSEDHICSYLREESLEKNDISSSEKSFYDSVNFAPLYFDPLDSNSSLSGWVNCAVVASYY